MAYGIFRKVTTLEFFQHHFAKSGHGDGLLMTRQLISTARQPPLHYLTRSVRRTSGFVLADHPTRAHAMLPITVFLAPNLELSGNLTCLEVDFVSRALDGPLHLVSLRPRCLLCHEHTGPWCENTHRIKLLLSRYEPAPIRWPVMGLPVRTREKGGVWRIGLAANRIHLLDEPTNGGDGFRVSAVPIANRDAPEQKDGERELFMPGEHEQGSSEFPNRQQIQREAPHSGSFRKRREDASNKLFTDRAGHVHPNE